MMMVQPNPSHIGDSSDNSTKIEDDGYVTFVVRHQQHPHHHPYSSHERRLHDKFRLWDGQIRNDAQVLWASPGCDELWNHYGRDVTDLQDVWYSHTLNWIQQLLVRRVSARKVGREYEKYVHHFQELMIELASRKRIHDLGSTLQIYQPLFAPNVSIKMSSLERLAKYELEGLSALYCLLRQRPDVLA